MANFTDNIQYLTNFTPYIAQQNTEAMLRVGMHKQQQYDQGIEKIQKSFDTVAGLQVSSKHKAYLQSKLNEMGNQMKIFGASDFSQGSLVNSLTSQTNSIANDEIVNTGVQSALRQKKEYEAMEKAREKGELTPAHQANFQDQENAWQQDDDLKKGYNAKYTPFFDADKLYIENISKVLPAGTSIDYVYEMKDGKVKTDADGNAILSKTMTRLKQEGKMPEDVLAAIELTANDPRVKEEMRIRGTYEYRNVTSEKLANDAVILANDNKTRLEDKIDQEYQKLSLDPENIEIQDKIANLKEGLKTVRDNLQRDGELIITNPNAVKNSLYNNYIKDKFLKAFSNVKITSEILKNEEYSQIWEERKFSSEMEHNQNLLEYDQANDRANREQTLNIHKDDLAFKYYNSELEYKKKEEENSSKPKKGDEAVLSNTEFDIDNKKTYDANLIHDNQTKIITQDFEKKRLLFLYKSNFANNPKVNAELNNLKDAGLSEEQAIKKIFERVAKKRNISYDNFLIKFEKDTSTLYQNNTKQLQEKNPIGLEAYSAYNSSRSLFKAQREVDDKVNEEYFRGFQKDLEKVNYKEQTIKIGNTIITMTKQDAIDAAVILKASQLGYSSLSIVEKVARDRLTRNGKSALIVSINNLKNSGNYLNRNRNGTDKTKGKGNVELRQEQYDKEHPNSAKSYKTLMSVFDIADKINKDSVKKDNNKRSEIIKKVANIRPNVSGKIFVGDSKIDEPTEANLRKLITVHNSKEKAQGEGASLFIKKFIESETSNDVKNRGIIININFDDEGNEIYSLTDIDNNNLIISRDEALKFKANSSQIFESNRARLERSRIEGNGGQSIKNVNLRDPNIYASHTPSMTNDDFPGLVGTGYTAKVTFHSFNGKYFTNIAASNGGKVIMLPPSKGQESLDDLMRELPLIMTEKNLKQFFKN